MLKPVLCSNPQTRLANLPRVKHVAKLSPHLALLLVRIGLTFKFGGSLGMLAPTDLVSGCGYGDHGDVLWGSGQGG